MNTTCTIHGETAQSMITHLAKGLDTAYSSENNEYCIDLPKPIGAGYFRGIQFSHGISVIECDVFLKKALFLTFEKETLNPLRLLFNSDNPIRHHIKGSDEENSTVNTVSKLQRVIFANGVSSSHSIRIEKQQHASIFIIHINRKSFEKKIDLFADTISEELALIFKDVNGVNHVSHQDYFSLEISKIIEAFKSCELDEFMKPVFLEGKTYEILTFQIQQFSDNLKGKNKTKVLRKATIEKIEKAVDIVKNELEIRINVNALAKRVGLTSNTLQSGFKALFKTSVNAFIIERRLELAKTLLEKSDLNVTEITYKIGINSRSYFSKLFKEKYGITPKEYLIQIRDTKSA